MAKPSATYQPLYGRRRFHLGNVRAWRSRDHLLVVETYFFTERYTRLFWAEMEGIVLYGLQTRSPVLLALELACLGSVLAPVFFRQTGSPSLAAFVFLLFYGLWRFGRPQWACEVATRTNARQFALPGTLTSCRRVVEEMQNSATQAQGELPETPMAQGAVTYRSKPLPKQPVLAVHVVAFVLGILSPFSVLLFVVYCPALIAAWFLQQNFKFPFAIRSAAVMSQILAILHVVFWVLGNAYPSGIRRFPFNHWQFGLPQVLFSLYGIMAVYWLSMELAKPRQKSATVLGLS